jgi:hypothetical protein
LISGKWKRGNWKVRKWFEFELVKDGKGKRGAKGEQVRRGDSFPHHSVSHTASTPVCHPRAHNANRVFERSHVSSRARVRTFVASVRDHRGCQRRTSGLPWRVLQSVSEARLRPRERVTDGW